MAHGVQWLLFPKFGYLAEVDRCRSRYCRSRRPRMEPPVPMCRLCISPGVCKRFKTLRTLLGVFDDIHATDSWGIDIFSYVNEQGEWINHLLQDCGRYRKDLWYCALKRSGLDARYDIAPCERVARYTPLYTPKHFLALCHLDLWSTDDLSGGSSAS